MIAEVLFLYLFSSVWFVGIGISIQITGAKREILKAIEEKKQSGTWGAGDVHYHPHRRGKEVKAPFCKPADGASAFSFPPEGLLNRGMIALSACAAQAKGAPYAHVYGPIVR